MSHTKQLDFFSFFKDRDQRHATIDQATLDERVKAVLKQLDWLCDDPNPKDRRGGKLGIKLPDGSMQISVPMSILAWRIGKSEPTCKKYVDIAASTPFLTLIPSEHSSHTFVINWLRIVDHGSADHGSTQQSSAQPNDSVSPATEWPVDHTVRHVKRSSGQDERSLETVRQGANEGAIEGANKGAKRPEFAPFTRPPVLKTPGALKSNTQIPPGSSKTGLMPRMSKTAEGGQIRDQGVSFPKPQPYSSYLSGSAKKPGSERPKWRPGGKGNGQILYRLKATFATFDPNDLDNVRSTYDRCVRYGAIAGSQRMLLAFFAEFVRARKKATQSIGGLLKELIFQNVRYANDEHEQEGSKLLAQTKGRGVDEQKSALLEAIASGRFASKGV